MSRIPRYLELWGCYLFIGSNFCCEIPGCCGQCMQTSLVLPTWPIALITAISYKTSECGQCMQTSLVPPTWPIALITAISYKTSECGQCMQTSLVLPTWPIALITAINYKTSEHFQICNVITGYLFLPYSIICRMGSDSVNVSWPAGLFGWLINPSLNFVMMSFNLC